MASWASSSHAAGIYGRCVHINRLLVATVALTLTSSFAQMSTASAATADAFVVQGHGNDLPGLTAVPAPQAVIFVGTMTVAGTNGALVRFACNWWGTAIVGDFAEEVGTMAGNCGPIALANCAFVRVATAWWMTCVTTIGEVDMHGVWTPTQLPPSVVDDYSLTAAGEVVE